jgi:hypothetical protein
MVAVITVEVMALRQWERLPLARIMEDLTEITAAITTRMAGTPAHNNIRISHRPHRAQPRAPNLLRDDEMPLRSTSMDAVT